MKAIGLASVIFVSFLMVVSCASSSTAQSGEGTEISKLIETKHFTFTAQSVSPSRGGTRQLTSEYDLRVSGDTLVAYLPYFGRAHVAPIDPTKGGIQFTSTDFTYDVEPKKKGRWNITMVPRGAGDVREMLLSVSDNGYASLQVLSNNRDPISFNGQVITGKRK